MLAHSTSPGGQNSGAVDGNVTHAYVRRGKQTEARQREFTERRDRFHRDLSEALRQAAPDLLAKLDTLDRWPEKVRLMQKNWIGRSEGVRIGFPYELGGEKRTLRIVARYAQEWNVWGMPDLLAQKSGVLEQHCEALGRDPATVQRSAVASG